MWPAETCTAYHTHNGSTFTLICDRCGEAVDTTGSGHTLTVTLPHTCRDMRVLYGAAADLGLQLGAMPKRPNPKNMAQNFWRLFDNQMI